MNRNILSDEKLSPEALSFISGYHQNIVSEVSQTVATERVVVVGMGQNPFVKKARKAFEEAGIEYKYLEYGNYFSKWKERLAIKLWSGWPTYPQVFVEGKLVGGYEDTKRFIEAGKIK
jgi:glutaredoxin-related protein